MAPDTSLQRGRVKLLNRLLGYGTVATDDGHLYPFQRSAMVFWAEFDHLHVGRPVRFDIKGGKAINVLIDAAH